MARAYAAQFDVPEAVAQHRLEVQGRAWDIVGRLKEALGSRLGGVSFDNSTGRFEIGVVGGAAQAGPAMPYLESRALTASTDIVAAKYSESALLAAKGELNSKLEGLLTRGELTTAVSASTDSVVVSLSDDASSEAGAEVEHAAAEVPVGVEVAREPAQSLKGSLTACSNTSYEGSTLFCTRPLRGGVGIVDLTTGGSCSLGYLVTTGTHEYVMTAGHCIAQEAHPEWASGNSKYNSNKSLYFIGGVADNLIDGETDAGLIELNAGQSPWFPDTSPSEVASLDPYGPWGANEDQALENISWAVEGGYNCRTGESSDTQCGVIPAGGVDQSVTFTGDGYRLTTLVTKTSECAKPGDSGGTVWGNHSGLGMTEGVSAECGQPGAFTWFTEAIRDLWALGHGSFKFYVPPYGETY